MCKFKSENPKLYNKIISNPNIKANVYLFWLKERPNQHYMVIDKRSIAWEEKHEIDKPRDICFEPDNQKEGIEWAKLFSLLIEEKGKQLIYE